MGFFNPLCLYVMLSDHLVCLPLSFHLSVLHGKNSNVVHYVQTFLPNSLIPAVIILVTAISNLYQFIPLSMTLTLAEGHDLIGKENLLASGFFVFLFFCFFFTFFN